MKLNFISKLSGILPQSIKIGVARREEEKIRRWIEAGGWRDDASQRQVADTLGIDGERMANWFRANTGLAFLQWRKHVRIEEAKVLLLKEKELPAALIGEAVGIPDKSNFRRQFRQLTGCTPAQWRLKHERHIGEE